MFDSASQKICNTTVLLTGYNSAYIHFHWFSLGDPRV